jgi:hypothetical protein
MLELIPHSLSPHCFLYILHLSSCSASLNFSLPSILILGTPFALELLVCSISLFLYTIPPARYNVYILRI